MSVYDCVFVYMFVCVFERKVRLRAKKKNIFRDKQYVCHLKVNMTQNLQAEVHNSKKSRSILNTDKSSTK